MTFYNSTMTNISNLNWQDSNEICQCGGTKPKIVSCLPLDMQTYFLNGVIDATKAKNKYLTWIKKEKAES